MKVAEVMTHPAWSVAPATPLREAAAVMAARQISGLPVVDGEERVIGVVSEADVLAKERRPARRRRGPAARGARRRRETLLAKAAAVTVEEAMTSPAITVTRDAPVAEAASLMVERDVERLPVIDGDGRLVGIITRADLVRGIADGHPFGPR